MSSGSPRRSPLRRDHTVLSPVVAAAVIVFVGGVVATQAGRAATGFLASLNLEQTRLHQFAGVRVEPPPRRSRRVVLAIVDGLALRESYGLPYLDSLRGRGIDAVARSHYPTISYANYVAIVTGVPPKWSGVRTNHFRRPVGLESIMDTAGERGLKSAYVADTSSAFGYLFPDALADHHIASWPGGFTRSIELTIERGYPLVVLLPGYVDAAGHDHGADSEAYRRAAHRADADLREGLDKLDLDRDTVIVVADHGHTDSGGHGGTEDEVARVPLVMAGAGIRSGAAVGDVDLVDLAPTAAALLGVRPPRYSTGRTITEALSLPAADKARIRRADRLRRERNRESAAAIARQADVQAERTRTRRLGVVAVGAALLVVALVLGRRTGALHVDWRVLAIAVPAFPVAYYALLDIFGQHFSPSAIPDRGTAMDTLFAFGLASTLVHVIAAGYALRHRVVLRDRLAAANALTLCGMLVSAIPAAAVWAWFEATPYVTLPGPQMFFLIPATYVAVSSFALATAATLGLEIVIFFARAADPRIRLRRLERAAERERSRLSGDR